ncbi:MAG: 3-deoxy-D-manno-octulosonic acid transferase [Cyclobacteriaceae bacterium]
MARMLYDLSIRGYIAALKLAAPWNKKAKAMLKGRKNVWIRYQTVFKKNTKKVVWFHCASLGEFEQGRTVIEAFKREFPQYFILVTFFSSSGYEVRKNYNHADAVMYLPWDTAKNARAFIELVKPRLAFFVKYEYWHHYLCELEKLNAEVYSISSIFRSNQLFFKPFGGFYRSFLNRFNYFFVQNEDSLRLLQSIGVENASISGDTRFDRVKEICANKKQIDIADEFKDGKPLMVIGSSWPSDIEILRPVIQSMTQELKFIIAPHEIGEKNIEGLMEMFGHECIRFSQASGKVARNYRILIIDNIGMLSSLYQYGEFAWIGGALRRSLHNTLEAATYGMPVFFGADPSNAKFAEAKDLVARGAAIEITTSEELENHLQILLNNEPTRKEMAKKASTYVNEKSGATALIMEFLKSRSYA